MMPIKKKNDMPLVSIAMCTYNGELFLREQMDSLIAQDYPNLEIVITDDGSTDSTVEILRQYEQDQGFIRVIQNEKNLGFSKNFEKSISLCSGEHIALCDQDDIWLPHKITTLINQIGDAGLIYSNVQLINEKGIEINETFPNVHRLEGHCHLSLLFSNCITGHTCLIKKSAMQSCMPFPDKITLHDHWLAFAIAATNGVVAAPQVLSMYRRHSSNAMLGKHKKTGKKTDRLMHKFYHKKAFLLAASSLAGLPSEDKALIETIANAYAKYPKCYTNRKLRRLLENDKTRLLAIYKNPEARIKKLSRGLWNELI